MVVCVLFQDTSPSRQEELRQHGVFYDDGYDYLQHMKTVDEMHKVQPTEVVFKLSAPSRQNTTKVGFWCSSLVYDF